MPFFFFEKKTITSLKRKEQDSKLKVYLLNKIIVGWYVLGYGLFGLQKKEYKNYETCKVKTLLSQSGLIRVDLPTISEEKKSLDIDE